MNHEGIGLGLTIVKSIIEQCKGTIQVTSPGLGKGSVFSFNMRMDLASDAQPSDVRVKRANDIEY